MKAFRQLARLYKAHKPSLRPKHPKWGNLHAQLGKPRWRMAVSPQGGQEEKSEPRARDMYKVF